MKRSVAALAARAALGWAAGLGAAAAAFGLMALLPREEAWDLGAAFVARAAVAAAGTSLAPLSPLAALLAAWSLARTLSERGEAAGMGALGLGRRGAFAASAPAWCLLCGFCGLAVALVEPLAWRVAQSGKGAPLLARSALRRLERGDVLVLPGGGAMVRDEGPRRLRFATDVDGLGWSGALNAPRAASEPGEAGLAASGWDFAALRVEEPRLTRGRAGGVWEADALRLRLREPERERWTAPPRGAWTLGIPALLARRADPDEPPSERARASFVLHKKLSWVSGVWVAAALGWGLAWTALPRAARWGLRLAGLSSAALGLFVLSRLADGAFASGAMGPFLAAWVPVLPAAAASALLWGRP